MTNFRHHHNNYRTEEIGTETVEDLARQMALDRDTALGNLAILGFEPDHTFEPREPIPALPENGLAPVVDIKRYKHQNEFGGRLEH